MNPPLPPADEARAGRIATAGIIIALASTAAGMMLRSPLLGGFGLVAVLIAIVFRRPLARLLPPRGGTQR